MCRSSPLVSLVAVALLLGGCAGSDDDAEPGTAVTGDPVFDDPASGDPDTSMPPSDEDQPVTPDPLLTFDSHERLFEEVFGIFSGEVWDMTPLSLPMFGPLFSQVQPESSTLLFADGRTALVGAALCRTGGGLIELEPPSSPGNFRWRARLDDCAPESEGAGLDFMSGDVEGNWNYNTSARSDDLSWSTAAGDRIRFDGEIRSAYESQVDDIISFVATEANLSARDGVDGALLLSIEGATSTRRIGNLDTCDVAFLSGGFTYRSTLTDGQAITVRTPVDLAYRWDWLEPAPPGVAPEELGELPLGDAHERTDEQRAAVQRARGRWAFTVGTLELLAEDGSRLQLDADTGDLDTVRLTLDAGDGEGAEELIVEWPGSWYRALAPPGTLPTARAEATEGDRRFDEPATSLAGRR